MTTAAYGLAAGAARRARRSPAVLDCWVPRPLVPAPFASARSCCLPCRKSCSPRRALSVSSSDRLSDPACGAVLRFHRVKESPTSFFRRELSRLRP